MSAGKRGVQETEPLADPVRDMANVVLPLVHDLPVERFREIDEAWRSVVAYIRGMETGIARLQEQLRPSQKG